MSKELIYSGKAKDIYTTEDENLIISTYKDQATAFNGVKKELRLFLWKLCSATIRRALSLNALV